MFAVLTRYKHFEIPHLRIHVPEVRHIFFRRCGWI